MADLAKINAVTEANLGKVNSVAKADIAKISGLDVSGCPTPGSSLQSYALGNEDDFSTNADEAYEGNAITLAADTCVTTLKLACSNPDSTAGTITGLIHAATGTVGTNAIRTGSVLGTSAGVDMSTIGVAAELVTFTFSPAIVLTAGDYVFSALFDYSAGGTIRAEEDRSSPPGTVNVDRNGTAFVWAMPFDVLT